MNPTGMRAAIMQALMQQQNSGAQPQQQAASAPQQQASAAAPQAGQKVDEYGNIIPDADVAVEWNKFQDWLRNKKMMGKPELDKDNLGPNLFKQFVKETGSKMTFDDIAAVRRLAKAENDRFIKEAQEGRGRIFNQDGVLLTKPEDVIAYYKKMTVEPWENNEKSKNPNYIGQYLSRFYIPLTYDRVTSNVDINSIKNREEFDKSVKSQETGIPIQYKKQ